MKMYNHFENHIIAINKNKIYLFYKGEKLCQMNMIV